MPSCKDKIRPVANHRRQSINKAHSIPHLQLSKKILGAIQSYLHHIKPSIGVRFKILVWAPLFFPLDGQTKGGVVVGTTGPIWRIHAQRLRSLKGERVKKTYLEHGDKHRINL